MTADIIKSLATKKEQKQCFETKSTSILYYSYSLLESKIPESRDKWFPLLNIETENAVRGEASLFVYSTEIHEGPT